MDLKNILWTRKTGNIMPTADIFDNLLGMQLHERDYGGVEKTIDFRPMIAVSDALAKPLKSCRVKILSESGVDSITIKRFGKNLYDPSMLEYGNVLSLITNPESQLYGYYYGRIAVWANQFDGANPQCRTKGQVRVSAWFASNTGEFVFRVRFFYDDGTSEDSTNIVAPLTGSRQSRTSASGKNCTGIIIRTTAGLTNQQGRIKDIQVEYGSTTTTFVPYEQPTIYTISLPETVHDGELDVINGILYTDGREISVTPTAIVFADGANTIYADTGDISLTYKAKK